MRRAGALLVALIATIAAVVVAMLEQLPDYRAADTAVQAVADAQDAERQVHELQKQRGTAAQRAGAATGTKPTADFDDYTDRIALLGQRITGFDRIGDPELQRSLHALEDLGHFKEAMAQRRGLLSGVFAAGTFTEQERSRYIAVRANLDERLHDFERSATEGQRSRLRTVLESPAATEAARYEVATWAGGRLPRPVDAARWWTAMTTVIDELRATQQVLADEITRQAQRLRTAAVRDLILCLAIGAVGCTAAIAFFLRRGRNNRATTDTLVEEISTSLVEGGAAEDAWNVLAQHVAALSAAHVLVRRTEGGSAARRTWIRIGPEDLERLQPAIATSCVTDVLSTARPVVLDDLCDHLVVPRCSLGPAAAIPVSSCGHVLGLLLAVRDKGAARFTKAQVDELIAITNNAARAVHLAEPQEAQRRADVLDDRARIAHGLYHDVIHQLIGIGMSLQSVLSLVPQARVRGRLHGAVERLDETVRQLRAVVFDLRSPNPECPLRQRLLHAAADQLEGTGITLIVQVPRSPDPTAPPELADEAEAMIRGIVARLAHSTEPTEVVLSLEKTDPLTMELRGDSTKLPVAWLAAELRELEQRAAQRGGTLSIIEDPTDTARVTWQARRGTDF